jgi:hypothetical protein
MVCLLCVVRGLRADHGPTVTLAARCILALAGEDRRAVRI